MPVGVKVREAGFAIVGVLPLCADWFYKVVVHPRPFWVLYYDGEVGYFYRGLRFASPYAPRMVEHPGVPLQLMSVPIAWAAGGDILRIDAMRNIGYTVALLLSIVAILSFRRTLFRDSPGWLWCAAMWLPFLAPTAFKYDANWTSDILFMPVAALVLAAVWRIDQRPKSLYAAGGAIGLAIATKIVFVAWFAGLAVYLLAEPYAMRTKLERLLRACIATGVAFLAVTLTLGRRFPSMIGWLWQLATHREAHSVGAGHTAQAVIDSFAEAPFWLTAATALAVLLFMRGRSLRLLFVLVSMAASVALSLRLPSADFHYFLPMAFASIGLMALVTGATSRRTCAAIALVVAVLVPMSLMEDVRRHDAEIAGQTKLRSDVEKAVHELAPSGVVVYSWRLPEPSLALKAVTTDPDVFARVNSVWPREGHWVYWRDRVFLPDGAKAWDLAVIRKDDLSAFPEAIGPAVRTIGDYQVVTRRPK